MDLLIRSVLDRQLLEGDWHLSQSDDLAADALSEFRGSSYAVQVWGEHISALRSDRFEFGNVVPQAL
ncbi:hypothetical protein [Sphingobium sp. Ant17]|uniref:hypothetical protein n=1 Tax=Sphingobium sp. Ant17 TaxID=1461752 RepID=UPI0013766F24|nr:hypothetical protein [Sphingobium sp. Ant17]